MMTLLKLRTIGVKTSEQEHISCANRDSENIIHVCYGYYQQAALGPVMEINIYTYPSSKNSEPYPTGRCHLTANLCLTEVHLSFLCYSLDHCSVAHLCVQQMDMHILCIMLSLDFTPSG